MKKFYNYIYLDPRYKCKLDIGNICLLYKPFYVGKGTNTRWKDHIKQCLKGKIDNRHKHYKIKKILESGYDLEKYIIKFNFTDDENKAYDLEYELINSINNLTNVENNRQCSKNERTYKVYDKYLKKDIKIPNYKFIIDRHDRYISIINLSTNKKQTIRKSLFDKTKHKRNVMSLPADKNPNWRKINVYNSKDELMFSNEGLNLHDFQKKFELPTLGYSVQHKGAPIHKMYKNSKFHLWYALYEGDEKQEEKTIISRKQIQIYNENNDLVFENDGTKNTKDYLSFMNLPLIFRGSATLKGKRIYMNRNNEKYTGWYALYKGDVIDEKWLSYKYDNMNNNKGNTVKNHTRIVKLFDNNDIFKYEITTSINGFYKQNPDFKLPISGLKKMIAISPNKLYESDYARTIAKKKNIEEFIGWRAEITPL